jgi:NAD(P)-dependent dehydrogenase (short-subunit alcohol dehydrogenase family)
LGPVQKSSSQAALRLEGWRLPDVDVAWMGRLNDRSIIVTGAAQGIGAVYAKHLAAEGARLSICDLSEPSAVADEIRAAGGQAISLATDVTSPAAVAALVKAAIDAYGTVHGLVNNAAMFGSLKHRHFTEIPSDEWDQVMAVNTRGVFECSKAVVPAMRKQKYGKIVNIASGTLFKGSTMIMHYVASKGAVVAMTRVMARELGDDNIMVNCIAPGLTVSPAVRNSYSDADIKANWAARSLKREEEPEDLVGPLTFFLSAESDFVTGQTLLVDGGNVMH